MNREFVKKMVRAEMLKYEAIKELLPDDFKKKAENLEREVLILIKDIALEIINDEKKEESCENKKTTKRVKVNFS